MGTPNNLLAAQLPVRFITVSYYSTFAWCDAVVHPTSCQFLASDLLSLRLSFSPALPFDGTLPTKEKETLATLALAA